MLLICCSFFYMSKYPRHFLPQKLRCTLRFAWRDSLSEITIRQGEHSPTLVGDNLRIKLMWQLLKHIWTFPFTILQAFSAVSLSPLVRESVINNFPTRTARLWLCKVLKATTPTLPHTHAGMYVCICAWTFAYEKQWHCCWWHYCLTLVPQRCKSAAVTVEPTMGRHSAAQQSTTKIDDDKQYAVDMNIALAIACSSNRLDCCCLSVHMSQLLFLSPYTCVCGIVECVEIVP